MARHASASRSAVRRVLTAVTTIGVALGAGVVSAEAASLPVVGGDYETGSLGKVDPQAGVQVLAGTVGYITGPVAGLKPNPLAGTGVDPLDNGVGTQLADFKPLTSQMLTGPVAQAPSVGSVPVVGQVLGAVR
ncbi:hypothetical protein [Streptomyces sp. NPDC004042]|uniref:hypothetical protein n=1 Tax=Streptomyces sp. NPDC004042 TaxID=3154451 RepID=UPI0033B6767C